MTTSTPACPVDDGFDPLAPGYLEDPFAVLARIAADERPVFFAPSIGYYVLTRWADIEEVFRDPETYSAAASQLPLVPLTPEAGQILLAGGHRSQPSMVSLDPPAHGRLRRPTTRAFTAKRVHDMVPRIRDAVRALLDATGDTSPFELVGALAFPLPATTIFLLMGVPRSDHDRVKRWCG
jgi:cytochrome P450